MRLVDAEKLKRGIKNHCIMPIWCHELVKAEIDATPTVDAVEVVRCEKCEELHREWYCGLTGMPVDEDDFCSFGKEKR